MVSRGRHGFACAFVLAFVILTACSSTGDDAKGVAASTSRTYQPSAISAADFKASDVPDPVTNDIVEASAVEPVAERKPIVRSVTPAPETANLQQHSPVSAPPPPVVTPSVSAPAPVKQAQSAQVAHDPTVLRAAKRHVEGFTRSEIISWGNPGRDAGSKSRTRFSDFVTVNLNGQRVIPVIGKSGPMLELPSSDGNRRWVRDFDVVMTPEPCLRARSGVTRTQETGKVAAGAGNSNIVCED